MESGMKLLTATFMLEACVCDRAGTGAVGSIGQIESTTALSTLLIIALLSDIMNEHWRGDKMLEPTS